MLRWCIRRKIVWTLVFAGLGLIIRFVLFGRLLGCMFVVHWFALVYCWVVRGAVFVEDGLPIQFILFGWLLGGMFVVHWFALLYGWVCMGAVVVEAGLRAASVSPFWLFISGIILCRAPLFLVIASFWGVHHIYVMGWGGLPVLGERWFLIVSGIVVHTVDVFRVVV